jgi:6-phosphogluconolactonase/glucosamine-6-phosphate isomerase/deaminase
MYQFFAAIGLGLALPLSAWAFPIDVEVRPDRANISVTTTDLANMAAVMLVSRGATPQQCSVGFVNGPERPMPRRIVLQPGEEQVVTQFFRREINRIRVTVECNEE